jgi:LemA protein
LEEEAVKGEWSEVLNQYQRRADLIPNLVNTVKGYAAHEQEVLTQVTEARAKVGTVNVSAETVDNPEQFKRFQEAQGGVTQALSRLIAVSEQYPQLKADQSFSQLQAQLEGTENRIAVARNRYIKAVQRYNTTVRSFPTVVTATVLGYRPKANFSVENERELAKPPTVSFGGQ